MTSFLPGQLTFFISTQTSRKKSRSVGHHSRIGFMSSYVSRSWQGWRDSNPQPTVLETAALPIRATPLRDQTFPSLCTVCLRQKRQYFARSSFSVFVFLFLVDV